MRYLVYILASLYFTMCSNYLSIFLVFKGNKYVQSCILNLGSNYKKNKKQINIVILKNN